MPKLEIALLGSPDIKIDGSPVKTNRRKAIALLAYLAVTGKSHTRDHLAALLWPDHEHNSAYANLRRTLWELKQILGEGWIEVDRERLALTASSDLWLDTVVLQETKQADSKEAGALTGVVDLYRGDFLDGFTVADAAPFEDWQFMQAEFFRRELANAIEKLVDAYTLIGKYETALPYARRWLALDELNESSHRAIMSLLAAMGDRTGAIRQYETCRQTLKAELGIDPQPETLELYESILQGKISGRRLPSGAAPRMKSSPDEIGYPAPCLPVMPTPFIGRRTELEQVKSLVLHPAQRLITLTGPGGTGKTRLAIQAAFEVEKSFPDGVFFASLASVQSADELIPAVAKAIDFSFYRDERPRQQLLDYLRERHLLLILDNFEHLIQATSLIGEMIAHAPGVKLMVTSRIRLNVQGEQLVPVGGMSIPYAAEAATWDDPEEQAKPFSAVQLFLERARRIKPNFGLTKKNTLPVIEICQLVQGMPLGLELAAAWVELLPPDEIATEIKRSLDFLETSQADVPDRQRSIRAVFESSWNLLTEGERVAFQRLCVFVGRFSREAAQEISGASLQTLLSLANKSWLQQTDSGHIQIHELMRQYGEERLKTDVDEWKESHDRHAAYFSDFVAQQSLRMQGPDQLAGLSAMEDEFDTNIQAAWDWLVAERRWGELIDRMALGFFQFGTIREQMDELIPWFREARLKLAPETGMEEQLAFSILGTLEVYSEELAGIEDTSPLKRLNTIWQFVHSHALAEAMGFWFVILASLVQARNLDPEAEKRLKKTIAWLREQNALWALGTSLLIQMYWWRPGGISIDEDKLLEASQIFKNLGVIYEQFIVAILLGEFSIARRRALVEITQHLQQAKQFLEKMGDNYHSFYFLTWAWIYFQKGEYEQGFSFIHEEQRIFERLGNQRSLAACLHVESLFAVRYSTFEHALETRFRSIELARKSDVQSNISWWLFELGEIYRIFGDEQKAMRLYEKARTSFEKMNMMLGLGYYQRACGDIALKQARYYDALANYQAFETHATQDNNAWSMTQAHSKLALAYAHLECGEQARFEMHEALAKSHDRGMDELILIALLSVPVCLIQEGNAERAVELAAFIAHHPASWNETKQQARDILQGASRNLPQEAVQAAIERGQALDLDLVVAELADRKARM